MKKHILFVSTCALLGLTSCGDVLDIYPVENNTAEQFYTNEYEMQQAVMGIYARLGRNGTNTDFPTDFYYQAMESRSDNLYKADMPNAQRDQVDLRNFQVTSTTGLNQSIYARLYQLIADANKLLSLAPEEFSRYRAEAQFLRAFAYFELVRAYGPQPVFDKPISREEAKNMSRQPIEDAYRLIINDLTSAASHLEDFYTGKETGRVGAVAAKCLLGEVYVTMAGYPLNDAGAYANAEKVLADIMPQAKARFATRFADIFDVEKENTYDIFSIQFASGNQGLGSSLAAYVTTSGSSGTCFPEWAYQGYNQQGQDFRADTLFVNKMKEVNDQRLEASVADGFWSTTDHGTTQEDYDENYVKRSVIIKFLTKDPTNNTIKAWNDYPLNFPVLRPADAYLLYAEALINNGKAESAKEWINAIRTRAGLADLDHTPTMDDIMYERRCEFIGEGKRYFDLVRSGKENFLKVMTDFSDHYEHVTKMGASNPAEKDMLLPIPNTVMNVHTTWQNNLGY